MKIDLRKIYRFTPLDHAPGAALPSGGNLSGNGGEAIIKEADKVNPVRGKLK